MKQWFPFTDYDFYAYLASGGLLLLGWDFAFNQSHWLSSQGWTVVQGVLAVGASYVLGSLIAAFSSVILEHWVTQKLLIRPSAIQLGFAQPRWVERLFSLLAAPRELSPLPPNVVALLASEHSDELAPETKAERIFFSAHANAIADPTAKARLDAFQNQYGMSRNLCFAFLCTAGFIAVGSWRGGPSIQYALIALVLALMLYARYLKFYAAFSLEVFRSEYRKKAN